MTQMNVDPELCRLCGSGNGVLTNIFEFSPTNDCIGKIEAVVPDIVILRDDSLSKFICHRCVAKVRGFYEFKNICISTQQFLKSRLPWMSSSQKNMPPREVSPCIKYIGGPLAFPFGQGEEEVEVLIVSDDEDGGETNAPLGLDHPRSQDLRSQASHSFEPMPSHWNESAPSSMSAQNSRIQSHGTSNNFGTGLSQLHKTPVKRRSPQATTARMGSSSGRGRLSLPSQSFRSFVQPDRTVTTMNRPGHQYNPTAASEPRKFPTAKRTCRQYPSAAARKSESDLLTVNRQTASSSFVSSTSATSSTVAIAPPVATPSIVAKPSVIVKPSPVVTPSKTSENISSGLSILPVGKVAATHRPNENACTPTGIKNIYSQPRHLGTVESSNNIGHSAAQPAKPKPRPKSKRKPVELTEADINNIRIKYPEIEAVKVCGSTVIFTCTKCNKMLLTEEAICDHECLTENSSEMADIKDQNENGLVLSQNKKSHNVSSYVELSSDEETSNDTEKHLCTVCSRLFHSSTRLQKHLETHS